MRRTFVSLYLSLCAVLLVSCSWTVPFYVVNNTSAPRALEIQLSPQQKGFIIFNPRQFALLAWSDGAADYERKKDLPTPWREHLTVEIPPYSALQIGYLSNDQYENSSQKFINDRVFNLVLLKAGKSEVNRATFDRHFQKTSHGIVWVLPQ